MRGNKWYFYCHLMPPNATLQVRQLGFLSQLHGIKDIHQRRCPVLPEALGKCARHSRACLLITSVIFAHYVGHSCSLRRSSLLKYVGWQTFVV